MIASLDVDYRSHCVVAACAGIARWTDAAPAFQKTLVSIQPPAAYEPGAFYRREMPYLVTILESLPALPEIVVIDGFVWLGQGVPGLGAHLFEALGGRAAIVGVAKRPYRDTTVGVQVRRGQSAAPLFVSAVGVDVDEAARGVASMHGPHRIPTLLKLVDRLSRDTPGGG